MLVNLKAHKIEKVCADERRPALAQPWLDVASSVLVATNGAALAVVPVDLELTDTDGPIPLLALDAGRRKARKDEIRGSASEISCNGTADVPAAHATFERPNVEEPLPNWHAMLEPPAPKHRLEVTLSPRLLWELAQALGAETGLTLRFYGAEKPIHVRALHHDGRGLVMPLRGRDDD